MKIRKPISDTEYKPATHTIRAFIKILLTIILRLFIDSFPLFVNHRFSHSPARPFKSKSPSKKKSAQLFADCMSIATTQMKNIKATILLFLALAFCMIPLQLLARQCPHCQVDQISSLSMNCPECGKSLHDPTLKYNSLKKATLCLKLYYTGSNPEHMPPYGKVYINGIYHGNIEMIEKEVISKDFSHKWSDGLGKNYSAFYERSLSNIPSGVLKIEIEMKFDRFFGLARSFKRVTFPYVNFEPGENTVVEHFFNSAVTFHEYKPEKRKPIPVVSEAKLQGASGTVALNVPLFD